MDSGEKSFLIGMLIVFVGLVSIIATFYVGAYAYHKLEVENFQNTIKDLSEEQKCLHICGFEFDGYLESYKFCAEKCDRISERLNGEQQNV
jgi:hypothetical protein